MIRDRLQISRCIALDDGPHDGVGVAAPTIADQAQFAEDSSFKGPFSLTMPATLLDHVTDKMRIFHEETFGPVKCIVRVDGVEAAVACANDNAYGLSAAVFGRDLARAMNVARRIESGICHVNGPTVHDEAQMPFGGVKASGMGRFGGKAGVHEFTELRWITVQMTPRHYPF